MKGAGLVFHGELPSVPEGECRGSGRMPTGWCSLEFRVCLLRGGPARGIGRSYSEDHQQGLAEPQRRAVPRRDG